MSESNALRGGYSPLPAPVVLNPLAAAAGAAETANRVFGVREKQAQQALGAILQQSTDANGNVDYQKAHTLAAQAGPVVQMGMQNMLLNAAKLRGAQLEQAQAHSRNIGQASLTILQDPSDANLEMVRQNLIRSGYPADVINKEIDAAKLLSEPDRRKWAYQHGLTAMDAGAAMNRTAGQTTIGQFGGTSAPVTTFQPSPYGPGGAAVGGGIPHTVSPESYYGPQSVVQGYNAQGEPVPSNDPSAVRWEKREMPRGPAFNVPPPGSFGPGGGGSGANPPGVPPPGTMPANPNAAPGAAPGRINPVPPPDSPLRKPGAAAQPAPGVATSAPTGAEEQTKAEQESYNSDVKQMPDFTRRATAGQAALEALKLVGSTGPLTDKFARLYAFAQAQGINPGVSPNDYTSPAAYQVLAKNLLRFAQDNASRSTNTDLGLSTQLKGNANVEDMLPSANRHVLIQDMGLLRQRMALTKGQDATGVGYRERTKNFPTETDATAFAWDLMEPNERQIYLKKIDPDGKHSSDAFKKWAKSMQIARDQGVWGANP